jgi:taurine dioxygenase
MGFTINTLSPVLGAEVVGLDLSSPLSDAEFQEINQVWLDHNGVVVFRGQVLTPEEHIAFSRRLGDLEEHVVGQFLLDGYPQIYRVSTKVDEDGKPMGNPESGRYWHSDLSYVKPPAKASLLYALEMPPSGGDTMVASMNAAYESLSLTMQQMLDGLTAVHNFDQVNKFFATSGPNQSQTALTPPVEHPVVRTHPETGRKALFVNPGFTTHIVELARSESDAVLEFLFAHITKPEFIYRHRWQVNDLLMWDNRCTVHHAVHDFYGTGHRHLHRTTVLGESAVTH